MRVVMTVYHDWALAVPRSSERLRRCTVEMYQCDKPIGKKAATKFLYPELGDIDGSLDKTIGCDAWPRSFAARQDG
jgi:hypothetical protein